MMWNCPNCGKECEGAFCGNCGAKQNEPVQTAAQEPVTQAAVEQNVIVRQEIKRQAKAALKSQYGVLLAMYVIILAIGGALAGLILVLNGGVDADAASSGLSQAENIATLFRFAGIMGLSSLSSIVSLLITSVVSFGYVHAMLEAYRNEPVGVGSMFSGFRQYGRMLGGFLWETLWLWLWGMIPIAGIVMIIIKGYAYSMMPYILFEHPELGVLEALKKSIAMTNGHKGEFFVRDLSFIGWGILSALTAGLLYIFYVGPYYALTHAGYYDALEHRRAQAETVPTGVQL